MGGLSSSRVLVFLSLSLASACGGGPTAPVAAETARLIGPRLGIAALAVGMGSEGRLFFDNFIPCTRRGFMHFVNDDHGREVTFEGCDLGNGVMVDGRGEIVWNPVGPGPLPVQDFCFDLIHPTYCARAAELRGFLRIRTPNTGAALVQRLDLEDVVIGPELGAFPQETGIPLGGPEFHSMKVRLAGTEIVVTDPEMPREVFPSVVTLDPIPNPGYGVAALTEADLHRVIWLGLGSLEWIWMDEASEGPTCRGPCPPREPHRHDLGCGTMDVAFTDESLPVITADMHDCDIRGLLVGGRFALRVENPGPTTPTTIVVEGELDLAGGVPSLHLRKATWTVVGGEEPGPGTVRIQGVLEDANGGRSAFDDARAWDDYRPHP